ncbi:CASP-like protein 5A2 [Lolium rigidum]|uniref:CASP-like protein 5A2 n=1 Tax=Lolium rigidum TaxID=89674 RepID=UPI001F5DB1B2|nr:CASP-like protein 5A2 [Lolium rigidum]
MGTKQREMAGAPGTRTGLGLRLVQAALAAAALGAMVSTGDDYRSVTGFRYFVPAVALQCMWSLAMATVDVYAILVGRSFRTPRVVSILSVGDWITGALTFSAASAAAGITVLINADLEFCDDNHCPNFMSATAMAFLSSFVIAPCCILNLGQMIYKLQRP